MATPIEKRWLCVFLSLTPHYSKLGQKSFQWVWQTIVYACSELVDIVIYSLASSIGQYSSCLYQPHYSEVYAPGVHINHSHNSCILVDTLHSWIQLYYSVTNILTIIINSIWGALGVRIHECSPLEFNPRSAPVLCRISIYPCRKIYPQVTGKIFDIWPAY